MKLGKRHKIFLTTSVVCLALGFLNYLLFSSHILFFSFLHIHPASSIIIHNAALRHIVTGYISDAFWVSALCLVTIVFTELKHLSLPERILILSLPLLLEFAQFFQLVAGTFDLADIALYVTVIMIFIFLFPCLLKLQR